MVTEEKYTRPPEIEAELAALPAPTTSDYLDRLKSGSIEVVVVARRRATDKNLRDQIDSILFERSVSPIRYAVRRHSGVPFEEFDEAEDEAMFLFWKSIHQGESFFEVRFNLATKRLAQHAGQKIYGGKQRERERSALRIGSDDSSESSGRDAVIDIPDDSDAYLQFENWHLIEVGMATLPVEQATAIILHYRLGMQIYSKDAAIQTVASELGCGERKARKLIADGKAALRRIINQEEDHA